MIRREPGHLLHAALTVTASLLLLSGHLVIGAILWTLAGLYVAHRVIAVARRRGLANRLASWVTVRLILVLGLAGPLIHGGVWAEPGADEQGIAVEWAAWVALGLMTVAIRTESVIGRAGRYQGLRIANIGPGPVQAPPRRILAALCLAEFAVLPVLLVLGLLGLPGWVWLVLLIPSGLFACLAVARAVRQRRRTREAGDWLPEVVANLAPEFVLYWDAPRGTAYQVGMWVPYLKRIGRPFFIMVRNPNTFNQAVSVSDGVPVILCRTMADMDRCMTDTLTTAFYVNNGAKNAHFVRYPQLTHVQLLHGDSDKASSFNPITVMFNKIYVAGQAGIDRYHDHGVDIPSEKFEIVGRPQVEDIAVGRPLPGIEQPRVLYAPTWRGNYSDASYSSLPQAPDLFEQLLARGCSIVFRPHPYCRKDAEFGEIIKQLHQRLAEHTRQTGIQHTYDAAAEREMSVVDCFNASDVMISDVSSVIVDYLHSEKPFALIAVDRTAESFIDEFPLAVASSVLSGEAAGWTGLLDQMFTQDPLVERRRSLRVHYLGDFERETYADGFVRAAARQVATRSRLAAAHEVRLEVEDPAEPDADPRVDPDVDPRVDPDDVDA